MAQRFIAGLALAGLVLAASATSAQTPAPPPTTSYRMTAAEVERSVTDLRAQAAAAKAPAGLAYVMQQGPNALRMDVRLGPTEGFHSYPTQGELFMVLGGSGTVTVGGQLVDPKPRGEELRAAGSTGGKAFTVRAGDVLMIGENTTFGVTRVNGELALATVHLPHPATPTPTQQPQRALVSGQEIARLAAGSRKSAPLLSAGPFAARLEVISGRSTARWSGATGAQMYLCLSGSGTMILGGQAYPVAKGDFILLPEGVARSVQKTGGKLVLLSLPLPRPAAE